MNRTQNILFSPFLRRIVLWFSTIYVSLAAVSLMFHFEFINFFFISFLHVVASAVILFYFVVIQLKYSVSFNTTTKNQQYETLIIWIVCISLIFGPSILRTHNTIMLTQYWPLFTILIFHYKYKKHNSRLLLPLTPPNLWKSIKKIIIFSILDSLQSVISLASLSTMAIIFGSLLYKDDFTLFNGVYLLFEIYLRSNLIFIYLFILCRGLTLVLLFPIEFAKLPLVYHSSSSSSPSVVISSSPSYASMKLLLSILGNNNSSSKSDMQELLFDTQSRFNNATITNNATNGFRRLPSSSSSSSNGISLTQPRWQRLSNYHLQHASKLFAQCIPCAIGYPLLPYFHNDAKSNAATSAIGSSSSSSSSNLVIKSLALQNLNKDVRMNSVWKRNLFANEELFTETILTTCLFVNAMTAQLQLIVSYGVEGVLKSHLQLVQSFKNSNISSSSSSKLQTKHKQPQQYSLVLNLIEKEIQNYVNTWSNGLNWLALDIIHAGASLRSKSWSGKIIEKILINQKKFGLPKSVYECCLDWNDQNEIDINNAFPPMLIQACIHAIESIYLLMQYALSYDIQGYSIHFVYLILQILVELHITLIKYEELLKLYYSLYPSRRKKFMTIHHDNNNSSDNNCSTSSSGGDSSMNNYSNNSSNTNQMMIKSIMMKYSRSLLNPEGLALTEAVDNGIDTLLRCYRDQLVLYTFPPHYNTIIQYKLSLL